MANILRRPPKPQPLPVPPQDNSAAEEARRRALLAASKRKGRAATLLTAGADLGEANVARRMLLGQ